MGNEEFLKACKKILVKYINDHSDPTDILRINETNIFPVWLTKVLENNKGLFATYLPDGMYYEITYNGDKKEFYLDAYKKFQNVPIKESDVL